MVEWTYVADVGAEKHGLSPDHTRQLGQRNLMRLSAKFRLVTPFSSDDMV